MVDAHAHKVFRARLLVELHQMVRIELIGRPDLADIFVAEFRGMAVVLDVIFVLFAALNIDIAGVPVAILGGRLRSPVRPDAELGVAEPFGHLVSLQPLTRPVEGSLLDFRNNVLRRRLAREKQRRRASYDANCISPADLRWNLSSFRYSNNYFISNSFINKYNKCFNCFGYPRSIF